jgi:DNA-directed RNA polymerase
MKETPMSMMQGENLIWEAVMKAEAVARAGKKRDAAREAGRESTAEPYLGLMHGIVKRAVKDLDARLRAKADGPGGKTHTGIARLRQADLSSREVAFIGTRTCIDGISQGHSIQALTERIGSRIADERDFREFKRHSPKLWAWMTASLAERGSQDYRHQRNVIEAAMQRADEEIPQLNWSKKDKAHVGLVVLDVLMLSGMLLKFQHGAGKAKRPMLRLSPEAEAAVAERDELVAELVRPWFKPTLCPPLDWAGPTDGGYHTCEMPLVKHQRRQHVERIRQAEMGEVYAALNAIQRTAWRVNEDVLTVAEMLWEGGDSGHGVLPAKDVGAKPARPDLPAPAAQGGRDLEGDEVLVHKIWKDATRAWHERSLKAVSMVSATTQVLGLARDLATREAFYFPHNLDYRGRAYAMPLLLNPQGDDLARGLLTFAEAKPVGEDGGFWLAVHGANAAGVEVTIDDVDGEIYTAKLDKLPLSERVDWVLEFEAEILAVAADPLESKVPCRPGGKTPLAFWTEGVSDPWQFLAFCLEWSRYVESGESPDFESSLPVSIDGSCNGLQHYAAILRDEDSAAAVNLRQADTPEDIYQRVADKVAARVKLDAAGAEGLGVSRIARAWLSYGVTRQLVKRQVMTTPYGVTMQGMFKQLVEQVGKDDRREEFESLWDACRYLSPVIYESIGEAVSSAREAMEYLQDVAREAASKALPINWVTPVGFPVRQELFSTRSFRIATKLLGGLNLRYAEDTDKLDRRRQVSSVAPNFVHSQDAAHLCHTIVQMEAERRHSWSVVHDSFGTHAGDVQALSLTLRRTFVELYDGREPLVTFVAQVAAGLPSGLELPAPPPQGKFDVREVLESEFFFA